MGKTVPDKTVPYSVEAEEAVLGSVLIDPEAIWRIESVLSPSSFYIKKHQLIYEALLSIARNGENLDFLTLINELETRKTINIIGGSMFISELLGAVPSAMHVESYAKIVSDTSVRRELLNTASGLASRAFNMENDVDETITWATATLQSNSMGGDIVPAKSVIEELHNEFVSYVDHPLKNDEVRGIATGWRDINAYLGGWKPGFYVILGEPHVGKSWFVLQAAMNVAMQGKRALLFSLEMKAVQLVRRLCLSHARVSQRNYDLGKITQEQAALFAEMEGIISEWNLDIVDDMSKASSIFSTIHREMRGLNPPSFIAIDYLGLIETNYQRESTNWEMIALTRQLKNTGRQLQVPIAAPHQISDKIITSRSDKRPQMSDGYGSGGMAQDADVILGLYRPEMHGGQPWEAHRMEVYKLKDRLSGGANANQPAVLVFTETGGLIDLPKQKETYGSYNPE